MFVEVIQKPFNMADMSSDAVFEFSARAKKEEGGERKSTELRIRCACLSGSIVQIANLKLQGFKRTRNCVKKDSEKTKVESPFFLVQKSAYFATPNV